MHVDRGIDIEFWDISSSDFKIAAFQKWCVWFEMIRDMSDREPWPYPMALTLDFQGENLK